MGDRNEQETAMTTKTKIAWNQLELFDADNMPVDATSGTGVTALRHFRRYGEMNGVFFASTGSDHEVEDDASTWGPKSTDLVDWSGFPVESWEAAAAEGLSYFWAQMHVGHPVAFVGQEWSDGGFNVDDNGEPKTDVNGNTVASFSAETLDASNPAHVKQVEEWYGA